MHIKISHRCIKILKKYIVNYTKKDYNTLVIFALPNIPNIQ